MRLDWHRHDELVLELSALHMHWLACYHETASPSDPIGWLSDFAEARARLRDWVAICGTRLDRDRPTRQTSWPGQTPANSSGEVEIFDRNRDFEAFVHDDVRQRQRLSRTCDGSAQREEDRSAASFKRSSVTCIVSLLRA